MYTFKLYDSEQLVELMYMNALKYDKETHSLTGNTLTLVIMQIFLSRLMVMNHQMQLSV